MPAGSHGRNHETHTSVHSCHNCGLLYSYLSLPFLCSLCCLPFAIQKLVWKSSIAKLLAVIKMCFDFKHVLLVLLVTAALITAAQANQNGSKARDTDAAYRSELTLKGLFNYYWRNDPANKDIEFLFVCGELGLVGTSKPSQCSCYNPSSCVNCYRWWTAIVMESVATYGIYMNTSNHSALPDVVYKHSPYNANWDAVATCTYVDDFLWYGIAYLRVYDWLSVSNCLYCYIASYTST
jgi:hypothetical protein